MTWQDMTSHDIAVRFGVYFAIVKYISFIHLSSNSEPYKGYVLVRKRENLNSSNW